MTLREELDAMAMWGTSRLTDQETRIDRVREHHLKALAILDEADVMGPGSLFTGKIERVTHRLVPDP